MKITPVLFVEAVEPALEFWCGRLGFTKVADVPHDGHIGFAMLAGEGVELMLQSWASATADVPTLGEFPRLSKCSLYLEVPDFAATVSRLGDWPIALPQRDAFYGMREVGVMAPGDHFVMLAAKL